MSIEKCFGLVAIALTFVCGCSQPDATDAAKDTSPVAAHGNHANNKESSDETPHWTYTGNTGPEHWASLHPDWAIAGDGKEQSPIDIAEVTDGDLPLIEFNYQPSRVNIINNGHTIQVNYDEGSSIKVDAKTYQLMQFHFHAPSEHTMDGKSSDLEMHLVHKSADGELAVVGVMINSGAANQPIEPVWKHLPVQAGDEQHHEDRINASGLLPAERAYYTYPGSLTTPPCSESVKWLVLTTPIEMSADQVAAFTSIYSGNNRPVQPLHNRTVTKSK